MQTDTTPRYTVTDRCDNFYEVADAATGRPALGIPLNGRFAFRVSAQEVADRLNAAELAHQTPEERAAEYGTDVARRARGRSG